jgi:23S rRNA (uracil1939-C5)-methyltransferase
VKASTLDFLRRERSGKRPGLIVPDLIVVDPPRTGLGPDVTVLLAEIAAPEIVYVSCDPATLVRDLRVLVDPRSGPRYVIDQITLADLFPQTFHLETVVRLRR